MQANPPPQPSPLTVSRFSWNFKVCFLRLKHLYINWMYTLLYTVKMSMYFHAVHNCSFDKCDLTVESLLTVGYILRVSLTNKFYKKRKIFFMKKQQHVCFHEPVNFLSSMNVDTHKLKGLHTNLLHESVAFSDFLSFQMVPRWNIIFLFVLYHIT